MKTISSVAWILAILFAATALAALVYDWTTAGVGALGTLAEHLQALGLSLEAFQAGVQRHVHPDLWDDVIVPALLTPTLAVAAVGAVVAFLIHRLTRPRA